MKRIAVAILMLWPQVALAQLNSPTYVYPGPNGSYIVTQPGALNSPPTYVNRMPNGGFVVTQPGALNNPPKYIYPMPNGGAVITQPGAVQPYNNQRNW